MISKIKKQNSGFALLISIIVTGMLLLISFVVINIALKQLVIAYASQESQSAFYAADSGIECAIFWDTKTGPGGSFDLTTTTGRVTCNGQTVTTGSESSVMTNPIATTSLVGGGSISTGVNFEFEDGLGGMCPKNWTCTGDAMTATSAYGQGCVIPGNISGNNYLKLGCDDTIGTAKSPNFILPAGIDHARALRSGGADGGNGSGWFIKRVSDDVVLCSAQNGSDTDNFFVDDCLGLSSYAGTNVYIYAVDNQTGSWAKTYLDNIRMMDVSNNVLLISATVPAPSVFQIDFGSACAVVLVTKTTTGDTTIDSRGYNNCSFTANRRFERGVSITY